MIESRLDEATDGTGGGYGKYAGLTVAQVAERFRFLVEEGQGRSARAILRIVHEQTEARGGLGTQRILAILAGLVTLGILVAKGVVPPDQRSRLDLYLYVTAGVTLLFVFGAVSVHRATVRGEAQVREIRRLALLSLDQIVQKPGFNAKELEREHVAALATLKKSDPAAWERVRTTLIL
ncbi:hypothetical protein EON82_04020 [bacterium]|nr:MAG: hypothetical protein EON82_04020 [bacterium]